MNNIKNNIAIIPARGGSKRIPRKNVKDFLGKPIIAYSIKSALESKLFCEVMVSTDDEEIANIAKKYGASVPFMRGQENSNDFAGISDVCIEVIEQYKRLGKNFDALCCISSTAPFVNSEKIIKAYNMLVSGKYTCVSLVVEYSHPIQRSLKIENGFMKMRWPENFSKRSQDFEKTYHDAGQFDFIKIETLLTERKLFAEKSCAIILNNLEAQDIDTEEDWIMAELKYKILNRKQG